MGRYTGILGLLTMLGLAYVFSTNRRAIRLKTVLWGLGLQFVFAVFVLRVDAGRIAFQHAGDAVTQLLSYAHAGSHFVFGDLGEAGSHLGLAISRWRAADGYFHRRIFCGSVLLRHHADHHQDFCVGDDASDGSERRGIAERCREHFYGTNRGAADDSTVSSGFDTIGVDDGNDKRDGARFRRNDGRLYFSESIPGIC